MDEWLIIYRNYTTEELREEIAWLKTESRNPYTQQTLGQNAGARDMTGIRLRLNAAYRVINERGGNPLIVDTVADFSGGVSGH